MIGRRKFLQALGAAPVAAPLLAKQAAENQIANLTRVGMLGGTNDSTPCAQATSGDTVVKFRQALTLGFKKQIEAIIYAEEHHVGYIDHDIAVLKSVSLSAKIAYQRKRNVERRIREMNTGVHYWDRLDSALDNLLKACL
jgi:hypothetical protein